LASALSQYNANGQLVSSTAAALSSVPVSTNSTTSQLVNQNTDQPTLF